MREAQYQAKLIKKIRFMLPGCVILKNDSSYMPGVPDILILFHSRWAMLEIKLSSDAYQQPNQDYYVHLLDEMSFASFINPQNEEEVLYDLQLSFGFDGSTCVSQSQ